MLLMTLCSLHVLMSLYFLCSLQEPADDDVTTSSQSTAPIDMRERATLRRERTSSSLEQPAPGAPYARSSAAGSSVGGARDSPIEENDTTEDDELELAGQLRGFKHPAILEAGGGGRVPEFGLM